MDQFFNLNYMVSSLPILLSYLDVTLFVTAVSFPIGLAIGAVTALARIHKTPVLSQISSVYISFIRGTPFLIQLFLICFGLPQVLRAFGASDIRSVPGIVFVLLMMSLHEGAYLSEVVRGALSALGNTLISCLKNTSLIFNAGVVDMMSKADLMGAYSYHHLELYLDVGLIYIALCAIVQIGVIIVNRSFRYA